MLSPASCAEVCSRGGPPGASFQYVSVVSVTPAGNVMRSMLAGFDSSRVLHISFGVGVGWQDPEVTVTRKTAKP